jgi:hypothetical protein
MNSWLYLEDILRRVSTAARRAKRVYPFMERRRARNAHIARHPARRVSFKQFWRQQSQAHPALRNQPRRYRRALVKEWWLQEVK